MRTWCLYHVRSWLLEPKGWLVFQLTLREGVVLCRTNESASAGMHLGHR